MTASPNFHIRTTLNISNKSHEDLEKLTSILGANKTDSINRALQVYCYIEEIIHNGGAVYIRTSPHGELEKLKIE